MASEGTYDAVGGYWTLYRGREITFDVEENEPIRSEYFEERAFPDLNEDANVIIALSKKPRHLSLFQVQSIIKMLGAKENPDLAKFVVKYHRTLASPLSCLIVVAIAIPFATGGVRTNPMVGVSKAILLFFGYYVVASICNILGKQAILGPFMAAWSPNFLLIGFFYLFVA